MDALKKIAMICALFAFGCTLFAQKSDLGLIYSSSNEESAGLEFRTQLSDRYELRLAFTQGSSSDFFNSNRQVASSTDTSVTFGNFHSVENFSTVRIGAQRRLMDSHFSVGADVLLGYGQQRRSYDESSVYRDDDGRYITIPTTQFPPGEWPAGSRVTRHYFVPGLRLSFNLDLPLADRFLIHLAASQNTSLPVYMGATNFQDSFDKFGGNPPSIINFSMSGSIGLRYIFKTKEK